MRWPKWTQWQLEVLEILRRGGEMTPKDIAKEAGYSDSNVVSSPLKKFVKKGLALKRGKGKNTTYRPYENSDPS